MIDCESFVFTTLKNALLQEFPSAEITSEYIDSPSRFPHISIVMSDCYMPERYMTCSAEEQTTAFMFEINIYSNKSATKKTECKKIAEIISKEMYSMNFVRITQTPIPNLENNSIYRIVARYRGTAHKNYLYRR